MLKTESKEVNMTIGEQNSEKTEMQVQEEMDSFQPRILMVGAPLLHRNGGVPGYDLLRNQILKFQKKLP